MRVLLKRPRPPASVQYRKYATTLLPSFIYLPREVAQTIGRLIRLGLRLGFLYAGEHLGPAAPFLVIILGLFAAGVLKPDAWDDFFKMIRDDTFSIPGILLMISFVLGQWSAWAAKRSAKRRERSIKIEVDDFL